MVFLCSSPFFKPKVQGICSPVASFYPLSVFVDRRPLPFHPLTVIVIAGGFPCTAAENHRYRRAPSQQATKPAWKLVSFRQLPLLYCQVFGENPRLPCRSPVTQLDASCASRAGFWLRCFTNSGQVPDAQRLLSPPGVATGR